MRQWFFVDGRLVSFSGSHADIVEQTRELRADGSTVKQAKAPKVLSPRILAKAAAHRREGR